jgi:hypothetical protein
MVARLHHRGTPVAHMVTMLGLSERQVRHHLHKVIAADLAPNPVPTWEEQRAAALARGKALVTAKVASGEWRLGHASTAPAATPGRPS